MILHNGDNLAYLKTIDDNTYDSIVTDPPYGIDFLGKSWDSNTGELELYKECLRVLKPGGYILAFSAARTYHRLATTIESAGFEIRDQLMWLYASGFPKAQDIGKAIQKRLGVEEYEKMCDTTANSGFGMTDHARVRAGVEWSTQETQVGIAKCTSPLAKEWSGYKTSLKPAHEPIVMARKPYKGSTIDNVLKNGLGALNIDGSRIPWADAHCDQQMYLNNINGGSRGTAAHGSTTQHCGGRFGFKIDKTINTLDDLSDGGRYPSNVIGEVAEGYQKYFYCPKVSRKERHCGFDAKIIPTGDNFGDGLENAAALHKDNSNINVGNNHPTVKPVALMDYLIKLVTPPSTKDLQRKVLDPFMGSGSTGMAVVKLGHHFTGCDLDNNYVEISKKRIEAFNDNGLDKELFE